MSIRQYQRTNIIPDLSLAELMMGASAAPEATSFHPVPPNFPPDARAVIHCPGKSVMTSGRANGCDWVLEFEPRSPEFIEPLMGWTGGSDPLRQVRLNFPNWESAVAYARREGLPVTIHESRAAQCRAVRLPDAFIQTEPFCDPLFHLAWERPDLVMPDLDAALLDPAGVFASPREVARHPLLTQTEKREILRRWLWDARRIEATADESPLDGGEPSRLDEVLDALALLDNANGETGGCGAVNQASAPAARSHARDGGRAA